MNYANMIEEKNLKKTFIIATLVSTLINTFAQGHNFYERFKQKKVDQKQSEAIKKLQEEVKERDKKMEEKDKERENAQKKKKRDDDSDDDDDDRDRRRNRSRGPRGREMISRRDLRDELDDALADSGWMIKKEYNNNYDRLGRRFAIGDATTQNELQQQIIMLQQTVINILQDALNSPDGVPPDAARLLRATNSAREGAIAALANQYQRMHGVPSLPPPNQPPSPPSSTISVKTLPPPEPPKDALYCRYAMNLQLNPYQGLDENFQYGGDMSCPACITQIPIEPARAWKINVEENGRDRVFHVNNRFVIKSHRSNGEFACSLCTKNRDVDTICESAKGLIRHTWRVHDPAEYEREIDIKEVTAPKKVEEIKVKEVKQIEAAPPRERDILEFRDNGRGKREVIEVRENGGQRDVREKVEVRDGGGNWREVREMREPEWREVVEIRENGSNKARSRATSVAGSRRGRD